MNLIQLLVLVLLVVFVFWVIRQIQDASVQKWATIIAAVIILIYLLEMLGVFGGLGLNGPLFRLR